MSAPRKPDESPKPGVKKHGSAGYKQGCRCGVCRDAVREYYREYQARQNPLRERHAAEMKALRERHAAEMKAERDAERQRVKAERDAERQRVKAERDAPKLRERLRRAEEAARKARELLALIEPPKPAAALPAPKPPLRQPSVAVVKSAATLARERLEANAYDDEDAAVVAAAGSNNRKAGREPDPPAPGPHEQRVSERCPACPYSVYALVERNASEAEKASALHAAQTAHWGRSPACKERVLGKRAGHA